MSFPRFQMVADKNAYTPGETTPVAINPAWVVQVKPDTQNPTHTKLCITNGMANTWMTVTMPFEQVLANLNAAQRSIVEVCQ